MLTSLKVILGVYYGLETKLEGKGAAAFCDTNKAAANKCILKKISRSVTRSMKNDREVRRMVF